MRSIIARIKSHGESDFFWNERNATLLIFHEKSSVESRKLVLLFGFGLIGSAIARRLEWNKYACIFRFDTSWSDAKLREKQFLAIKQAVFEIGRKESCELHLVWSAGKGGFASSETDLRDEQTSFDATLSLFQTLLPSQKGIFHFISSAGGLFEGQRLVEQTSEPNPLRPYGVMKLHQEMQLAGLEDGAHRRTRIYRPSTVFGAQEFNFRSGLISHLIWNALRNQPTTLESNLQALRDYVFVEDVGRYVVRKIQTGMNDSDEVCHLVSSKPSSIFEVTRKVQKLLGKAILYQFSDVHQNNANITFCRNALPQDWSPANLDFGLSEVLRKTRMFIYGAPSSK
ncbi:MAG: nucleoside-diphosphate-sugar epimerase [Lysobacterales bacterium]